MTAPRDAPRPPVPARSGSGPAGPSLEVRIGQNWMAWVGAIVIVVGAAFLVKLGYDAGWWSRLTPLTRCLLVAGFGATLLVAGEAALRRIGPAASVGLFGAGLGTLYLDAYAAFEWFEPPIASREGAFALMGLVALVGFGITLRTAFRTIGVLSIIGGYLTPFLMGGGAVHTIEVGVYLTMLLAVSLGLSVARPPSFRALRYVAMGGQGVLGFAWALDAVSSSWFVALFFVTVWWALIFAEAVWAALREQSAVGNVVASLLATAWYVTVGCIVLAEWRPAVGFDWQGTYTASVALVCAVVAAQFGPNLGELRKRPRTPIDMLSVALSAQACLLVAIAVALQFEGYGQSIGWLAVGLGSIEIGRRLHLRGLEIFGLAVGALALGRVVLLDHLSVVMGTELFSFGEVSVTNWSVLVLVAILVTHAAAHRLRPIWRATPIILVALATAGWLAVCANQCRGLWLTGGWLAGCATMVAIERFGRRQRYLELGLLALVVTAGKWLLVDALANRVATGWDAADSLPVLNGQMGLAAAIAGVGWWAAHLLARREQRLPEQAREGWGFAVWQLVVAAASVLLLAAMSFEVDRIVSALEAQGRTVAWTYDQLRWLFLTLMWTVGAVGFGLAGRWLVGGPGRAGRPNLLILLAWSILVLCAIKWVFGDTLYWAVVDRSGRTLDVRPFANIQMLAGIVLAVSALVLYAMTSAPETEAPQRGLRLEPAGLLAAAAGGVVLWGLSFEIDRAVGLYESTRPADWAPTWPPLLLRSLWLTLLWAAGGLGMTLWCRVRLLPSMFLAGWGVVIVAAIWWLGYDTLGWRLIHGVVLAPVVFNLQFGAGALLAVILAAALWNLRHLGAADGMSEETREAVGLRRLALGLVALIGLWLGSLELDRFFAPEAGRLEQNAAMARQTALSIYWALYAMMLVALGFAKRSAASRYAGLALLAVTLGKVLTVDMAEVRYVYRVLSLLGVGLLLVVTSVGYAKLAPRLLAETRDRRPLPARPLPADRGADRPVPRRP